MDFTYENDVPAATQTFMNSVTDAIINPILGVIFAAALVYFLYGVMVFIMNAGDQGKRVEGKQHMLWGTVGMVVMVTVGAILAMGLSTFGIDENEVPDGTPLEL